MGDVTDDEEPAQETGCDQRDGRPGNEVVGAIARDGRIDEKEAKGENARRDEGDRERATRAWSRRERMRYGAVVQGMLSHDRGSRSDWSGGFGWVSKGARVGGE